MDFKVHKIHVSKKKIRNKFWRKIVRFFGLRLAIVFVSIFILIGIFAGGAVVLNSDFFLFQKTREFFSFGTLKNDQNKHTNILFLGVGGEGTEGGNLSDSIMIASINPENPSVSFLSLPRDLFIPSAIGDRKVNEIYAAARYKKGDRKGLEIIKEALSDFTGIPIHYGVVINFKAFQEVVDALGGITTFIPETIEDPFYPDENYGYQTFIIRKGLQHLDGATALKYARSRKTSSDYSRAQRQQELMLSIREKAESLNFFTDFEKLKDFFQIYRHYINTDIGLTEMIALSKIAIAIDYENAVTAVLNDDPMNTGGYLYTPAKEFYGGQFVLLPENLKETQLFMDLVLIHPEILLENAQISVLNGSKIGGKASKMSIRLRRLGFHVIDVGNYDSERPLFKSFIRDISGETKQKTKKFLKELFDAPVESIPLDEMNQEDLIDLQLILGTN
jgi:LCP family protein required for cell wall assembly